MSLLRRRSERAVFKLLQVGFGAWAVAVRLGLRAGEAQYDADSDRGDPARGHAWHSTGGHRCHLRTRPFRGGCRTGAARAPGFRASPCLHERRVDR